MLQRAHTYVSLSYLVVFVPELRQRLPFVVAEIRLLLQQCSCLLAAQLLLHQDAEDEGEGLDAAGNLSRGKAGRLCRDAVQGAAGSEGERDERETEWGRRR